jgi:hypothetical protein
MHEVSPKVSILTGVNESAAHTPCDGFWHGTGHRRGCGGARTAVNSGIDRPSYYTPQAVLACDVSGCEPAQGDVDPRFRHRSSLGTSGEIMASKGVSNVHALSGEQIGHLSAMSLGRRGNQGIGLRR